MKNVIIAWATGDEKSFENHVPLLFVGQRNQALGFSNNIHVLFMQGLEQLSQAYKSSLQVCGYVLHDVSQLYSQFAQAYSILRHFGDYETKCFLRWLVIEKFFAGDQIIHYDGDIVFNDDPKIIAQKVAGLTFVLQGCPAFTVISNRTWFEQYKHELDLFTNDINGYSARAWQMRQGWQVTFTTRWSGSRFREIITSDQDFISHLMHTGAIKQDPVEQIKLALDDYVIFQNPLLIHLYNEQIPYRYQREQGIDYFLWDRADGPNQAYRKKVLLWHMQSCFTFYASKYILRKKYIGLLRFTRQGYNPSGKTLEDTLNKHVARFTHHTLRRNVYEYFFKTHDFRSLMNSKTWWKEGVFL